ncbi:hypothetical protein [Polyangium fumosum]|uniref:Dickkopf N-terminal cysteine-rich domain-containing protein n=1 Tax=Polyangium fumosum TaxID=889272 RepID=A0A4U1JC44_9BACT|nr:hypothetical protein [Polyangium fumosum]TKD07420.1 hypothetical protein E8A74_18430 [Polyangium fumosum]
MRPAFLLLFVFGVFGGCTCGKDAGSGATPSASAPASAAPSASAPAANTSTPDDEVRPVYPKTNDPPDPLAEKLCDALHGVPTKRRATCCGHAPGFSLAAECTRTLSYALREKAVTVDAAAADACIAAMEKAHEGCAWVGPTGAPLPAACDGLVRGVLAEDKPCRSSLECGDGLRCLGVGPTDTGTCRRPLPTGFPCGVSVDTLAALTRQDTFEARHPECSGYCAQRRCRELVAEGGACKLDVACGAGKICDDGKCRAGALPGEGRTCKLTCAAGLRCEKGQCVGPKEEGAACERDVECRGGCLRGDAGKGGTCGMKCRML